MKIEAYFSFDIKKEKEEEFEDILIKKWKEEFKIKEGNIVRFYIEVTEEQAEKMKLILM